MTRRRLAWIALGVAGAVAALAVAALVTVRSSWFYEKVRQEIVSQVETATGGRVEVKAFTFDWPRLRAEITGFTLHGTEPAGKPPLFRAASVAVGLKIVSVFRRKVDLEYVDVAEPQIYLIVSPDGRTNIPEPKIKSRSERNAVETILNVAVGRFTLQNGVCEVESGGRTPFDIRGRNLDAKFAYELAGPRYRGELAVQPLDVRVAGYTPTPVNANMSLTVEKNRLGITSAKLATGDSQVEFSGAIEDWRAPHGSFQYQARASQADVARFLHTKLLENGAAQVGGNAVWAGGGNFSVTGNLHAYNLEYRDAYVRLRDFRADGALSAGPRGVEVTGLRLSGFYVRPANRIPVDGRIAATTIRGVDIDFRGIDLAGLGGSFHGAGRLHDLNQFRFEGDIEGFQARRVVAVYSPEPLPWDGRAFGPVRLEGALRTSRDVRIAANLSITPEAGSPPVRGQVNASYDARDGILDLGRSTLTLPASRADFSGAFGRELRVHLETRDLNDLLPAVGQSAASVPLKLEGGAAVFDGTVTGSIQDPRIAGRLSIGRFSFSGKSFDSLTAKVTASPENVRLEDAALARGALRAQFQAAVALRDWKTEASSAIFGNGSVRNAPLADLAGLLDWQGPAVSGTLTAAAQASGTISNPIVQSDVEIAKGGFDSEPFDRFSARLSYSGRTVEAASGEIVAGAKRVQATAAYTHADGSFETGRLRFQAATNAMPLEQIATLEKARPGIGGTVEVKADGSLDFEPPRKGERGFRIENLHADVAARGLRLSGQPLGDARLTANTEGRTLHAHLESDFAKSVVRGDGSWRLEDDYPGSATVAFSKLDFAQLRAWVAPAESSAPAFFGSAEGELRIDGPALRPAALKAELRIPKLELGPAPNTGLASGRAPVTLHNNGPIVATMANSIVTIESARLEGRATDLTVGGRALLDQKNPLDLKVNGRIDLGILEDFEPDLSSSGTVTAVATVRGAPDALQIAGRMEAQNVSLNLADFPNGLSNGNGVIIFTGERATIQSFSAETGGGKVTLSGFAAYSGGPTIFRLHADAREVRVRYPEGVSTVANGALSLTGTAERSMLSGTITILRTGFNPQSDLSSLLARSAEPVQTPSVRTGPLGGLNFDIQIQTAPDIQVQSTLTQDIEVEANLRLRGTVSSPAIQGRINITQGQLLFFGTKYTISQGSIAFFNPLKIEPIVNLDLETKARGIDITLTVSGPLGKLTLTPRSDPPLQLNEIVALLATGQAPTSDPTLLARQSTAPQSWQQMGASTLLGQAIASPVAGRLQRFFGVSRLRIDPTLRTGVEYNPQARLTFEEQVTPQITFTYITVINSSNPQVVRMEWDFSKQWSAVLLREENGVFGLDFFFKKQFK